MKKEMKNYGTTAEFAQERNRELMRVYRQKLGEAGYIVKPAIFRAVADAPSRRFWVSEERAAIVVSAMESGRGPQCMTQTKREMFEEIHRRYLALRRERPGESLRELVAEVVHQGAPRFYLTPRTAGEIIYRMIRGGWYEIKHR